MLLSCTMQLEDAFHYLMLHTYARFYKSPWSPDLILIRNAACFFSFLITAVCVYVCLHSVCIVYPITGAVLMYFSSNNHLDPLIILSSGSREAGFYPSMQWANGIYSLDRSPIFQRDH